MKDEIIFDGVRFISAMDAGAISGWSRDYVARLCRSGKLLGRRVGKNWYVDEQSLRSFIVGQQFSKLHRKESLAQERLLEYHASPSRPRPVAQLPSQHARVMQPPLARQRVPIAVEKAINFFGTPPGIAHAALQAAHIPPYAVSPFTELLHKFIALTFALVLTLGTYAAIDRNFARFTVGSIRDDVANASRIFAQADTAIASVQAQTALAAESPNTTLAAYLGALSSSTRSLAKLVKADVDTFAYEVISLPTAIRSYADVDGSRATVSVQVLPYAGPTSSNMLCVTKSDATEACVTGDQLAALLATLTSRTAVATSTTGSTTSPTTAETSASAATQRASSSEATTTPAQ